MALDVRLSMNTNGVVFVDGAAFWWAVVVRAQSSDVGFASESS